MRLLTLGSAVAGTGSVIQRWTITLLLLIAVLVVTYIGGCAHGMRAALQAQQASTQKAQQAQLTRDEKELQRRADFNAEQTVQAATARAADQATYLKLKAEVPHAVLISPPAGAGGDCRFSDDFVRLWNGALSATAADAAPGAADAAGATGDAARASQP